MDWRLLEGVPAVDVRRLLSIARRRRFARNEIVFHRDDPGDSLHLIATGRFAIRVMTPLGDTVTIAVRGPTESFGEMALVGRDTHRTATVLALEPAETFAVFKDEFHRLRAQYPSINEVLFAFLVGEIRMLNERLLEALYVPADRRILRRLRDLGNDPGAEIPLTQEALAELAGTSRSTVNRVLRDEERRGTVALSRGRTRVLDPNQVAKRAR
jgi:CRP/FNR family transcriptional regulator, cyclic AMP receptor protein